MMRILFLLIFAVAAWAQHSTFTIRSGATLPGSCVDGKEAYFYTGGTAGQRWYLCEGGTFAKQGDGTGTGFGETSLAGLANNQTLWDGASASRTLTFGLSGATDPVITFADNSVSFNTPVTAPGFVGSGDNYLQMTQSAATAADSNSIRIIPPTSITTAYRWILPGAVGATGVLKGTVSGTDATLSLAAIADPDVPDTITVSNYCALAGCTMTGALAVEAEAYDATGWNGDTGAPQKDAVRDKIETLQPLDAALTALAGGSDFVAFSGPTTSTKTFTLPDASSTLTITVASGTKALDTDAIASTACDTLAATTATGVASTDVILITPNADITGVTGYTAATTGGLQIFFWPTTNTINWKVCNPTTSSITPGAVTLNYRVVR